jgi:hypothetical protein
LPQKARPGDYPDDNEVTALLNQSVWRQWGVWIAVLAMNVCLASATTYFGRRFSIDEVWYKAAGLHLVTEGRFSAPEITGSNPARVDASVVFASQPPLYPLAFGGFVKVFGFGPDQVVAFDAIIRAALSLCCFRLLGVVAKGDAVSAGLALLVWPLGTAGRPDEMAMCFGIAALLVILRARIGPAGAVVSGLLLGLSTATSVGCGIVYAIAWVACLARPTSTTGIGQARATVRYVLRRLGLTALAGSSAAALFAVTVAPIWLGHRGSFDQFQANAASATDLTHMVQQWVVTLEPVHAPSLPSVGLAVAALAIAIGARPTGGPANPTRWLAAAAVLGYAFIAFRLPSKWTYLWMVAPIAVAAVRGWTVHRPRPAGPGWSARRPTVAAAALLALAIGGSLMPLRDAALVLTCPADQRLRAVGPRIRRLVPPGTVVLADDHWSILAADHRVYDPYFVSDAVLPSVQYIVLSGNFSGGVGQPRGLRPSEADVRRANFTVIDDSLSRRPPKIAGVRVGRSNYGYGAVIYRRMANLPAL